MREYGGALSATRLTALVEVRAAWRGGLRHENSQGGGPRQGGGLVV